MCVHCAIEIEKKILSKKYGKKILSKKFEIWFLDHIYRKEKHETINQTIPTKTGAPIRKCEIPANVQSWEFHG